jgi:hypothetical protein
MPHFMVSCNYSAESKNALIANPVDRTKAASAAVEAVGGKLHSAANLHRLVHSQGHKSRLEDQAQLVHGGHFRPVDQSGSGTDDD